MRACRSAGRRSLRGKTNQEPKKAGTNHGSHRIDPREVSIRMPAWPIDVARTMSMLSERWAGRAAGGLRRRAAHTGLTGPSCDGRVRVGLALAGHVLGPLLAVPVAHLV